MAAHTPEWSSVSENSITGAVPLYAENPAEDPTEAELLMLIDEDIQELAAARGLRAIDVRIVEWLPGLYDDDGHYVLDENDIPVQPRTVMFRAEGVAPEATA